MSQIGRLPNVSDELYASCEQFVCCLYGSKRHISVNSLRYAMFCAGVSLSTQLPPTQDALCQHVQRANYQAAVWRNALVAKPDLPSPNGHGWVYSQDGVLKIDWMDQQPAPIELLELVSCSCTTGCSNGRCSCYKASLSCTDACLCTNCENNTAVNAEESGPDVSGDDTNSSDDDLT